MRSSCTGQLLVAIVLCAKCISQSHVQVVRGNCVCFMLMPVAMLQMLVAIVCACCMCQLHVLVVCGKCLCLTLMPVAMLQMFVAIVCA